MADAELTREIETKYDVPIDAPLPDLVHVAGVATVSDPALSEPNSTYFDTAALVLTRHRITLRRRTGTADAGWHIKMPMAENERLEVRRPLDDDGNDEAHDHVPADVLAPVRSLVRGEELTPLASIRTQRTVITVGTKTVPCAAEFCDDHVVAVDLRASVQTQWHEWEVELLDGDRKLLQKIDAAVTASGARAATTGSKLERALSTTTRPAPKPRPSEPGRKADAGEAAVYAVATDFDALLAADPRVRLDEDDSVHSMRVATRRLRSVLGAYRKVFDAPVQEIRTELAWLAALLGQARDAEVIAARYESALAELDEDLIRGPVYQTLVTGSRTTYAQAHERIVAELDGERYFALLDRLEALVADPPLTDTAEVRAKKFLESAVRRRVRAVSKARRAAEAAEGVEREELLHEVRKSAKKLRYTTSEAAPVLGKRATRIHDTAKALQTILGDHQDAALSRTTLRDAATAAHERGEDTFTYGVLHEREGVAGERSLDGYDDAAAALDAAVDR